MFLGDRMKRYELQSQAHLTPKIPVIVRVDGRSFHSLTKRMNARKPYDPTLLNAMIQSAKNTREEIPSCKLIYQQSDEVSFLLSDLQNDKADAWFDYNVSKLTSVIASTFTALFNTEIGPYWSELGTFDARAFNVPLDEVANYFIWRMKDAERNALSSAVHAFYTHEEAQGANADAQRAMLKQRGVDFESFDCDFKKGYFANRHGPYWVEPIYNLVDTIVKMECL